MDNKKFIITTSEETAALLIRANFNLIQTDDKRWVFMNEPGKLVFEKLDDMAYTNRLAL